MELRRRRVCAVLLLLAASFLIYSHFAHTSVATLHAASIGAILDLPSLPVANATLGFGAIAAVSRAGSPRRESLLLAANITGLDIVIPTQPKWSENDLASIRAEKDSTISDGSALAWLGHLNALRWFLSTDLDTVLLLEDDVDWDIHLRRDQVPKVAAAVRHLMAHPATSHRAPDRHFLDPESAGGYWGANASWDMLYLGHCGDIFKPLQWTFRVPRAAFFDPTLPQMHDLHATTQDFLHALQIPPQVRMVHRSISPLCTFGFALTRHAAHRLLTEIAQREQNGGTQAYDVRILEACRDEGLRCWSVNPELFHHLDAESEIASVNSGAGAGGGGDGGLKAGSMTPKGGDATDARGRLQGPLDGLAPNIACGARSRNFRTKDPKTLEYLQEVVGRQGKCLRDEVEEDMSRGP